MRQEQGSDFSGVAGRVLSGTISVTSVVSGMVLGLALFVVDWILLAAGAGGMIGPFTLFVMACALARFAVNGLFGEWSGTVLSSSGGPWTAVGAVASRYLALTFVWYAPTMLIGSAVAGPAAEAPAMGLPSMSGGQTAVVAIQLLGMILTPPLFLIVSVASEGFADVFATQTWNRVFAGRKDDLFAVYAIYAGAICMVLCLALPLTLFALAVDVKLALVVAALGAALVFGVSVNLLGRLCGFFACGTVDNDQSMELVEPPVVPTSTAAPQPASPPSPAKVPPTPTDTAPTPAEESAQAAAKLPPLTDPRRRVDDAVQDFERDPDSALLALAALREAFAPHPTVLQAQALFAYRAGRSEEALEHAREAIPLCLERGQSFLAAEVFRELKPLRSRLGLGLEQWLTIGNTLVKMDDPATAAKAFSAVIGLDHGETRAIKGLLHVAEKILRELHKPEAAAKVYRFLIQHCSASPLVEYMRSGLEDAERRMAHSSMP